MQHRCPGCGSYGLYPIRRSWLERLFGVRRRYRCIDCDVVFDLEVLRQP